MVNYKKVFIISILAVSLIFSTNFSLAAARKLEVPIPGLDSATLPALPQYIIALFNFSLLVIGVIVFGALVYGGFRYLTSAGSPAALADAKDQIYSALLGLVILFSSYLILDTINPELIFLREAEKGCTSDANCSGGQICVGGVCSTYPTWMFPITVYQDAGFSGNSCQIGRTAKSITEYCGAGWDNTVTSIEIKNPEFVLVIHEHEEFTGKAELLDSSREKLDAHLNNAISSLTLIKKGGDSSRKATLYGDSYFRSTVVDLYSKGFSISNPNLLDIKYNGSDFNDKASSATVEKDVLAIIYEHPDYKGAGRIIAKDADNFDTCFPENICPGCGLCVLCECWNDKVSSIQIVHGRVVLLEGYPYAYAIPITGQSWAGKGYVVPITVNYGVCANAPGVVCLGCPIDGTCKEDFGDIRFYDDNSTTELKYWLKSYTPAVSAEFWVRVDDDLSDPNFGNPWDTTIYLAYGNPTATTTSNPKATFMFFDDFETNDGFWAYSENGAAWVDGGYTGGRYLISYPSATASSPGWYGRITSDPISIPGMLCPWLTPIKVELEVEDNYGGATSPYHFKQVYFDGSQKWSDDVAGAEGVVAVTSDFSVCSGDKIMYLQVYENQGVGNFGVNVYFDNLRIRRYVFPEPVVGIAY